MMEVDAAQQTNGRHDEEDGLQESLSSELQETARSNHDPVTVVVEIKTNGCLNAPSAIADDCSGASPPPPLACSPPPSPSLAAATSPRHGSSPLPPARLGPLSAEQLSAVLRGGATVPASSSSSSSVTTTTNRSPAAATSSPATLERLQAELRGLRDEMDTMKSQHNKEIKLLMNELDEEKRIRLTMQMEMQRMNKRMSKMS